MLKFQMFGTTIFLSSLLVAAAPPLRAADCEDVIARHMVAEAMLAAQFIAAAEWNGMTPGAINEALKDIVAKSAIEEFSITDSNGHVYLTNAYGSRFHLQPRSRKSAAGFCILASYRRQQENHYPGSAQARDRRQSVQVCRRRRDRQAAHRGSGRHSSEFVQVIGLSAP